MNQKRSSLTYTYRYPMRLLGRFGHGAWLLMAVFAFGAEAFAQGGIYRTTSVATTPVPAPPPAPVDYVNKMEIVNNSTSLHIGSVLLNPYEIDTANGNVLERGDSEANFMIEFAYNNIGAWNPKRIEKINELEGKQRWIGNNEGSWFDNRIDIQAKIAYFLETNDGDLPSGSTIVGSGDFSAEVNLGVNLFQSRLAGGGANTFGLQFGYGATTDKASFDVHNRIAFGLGYTASLPWSLTGQANDPPRNVLLNVRGGGGFIETVDFVGPGSRAVQVVNGDVVDFDLEFGGMLEFEAYIPVSKTANVLLGTRIYPGHDPNPWNAFVAYSVATDKLLNALTGN